MTPHIACFLAYPGVASYDVAGPAQALALARDGRYQVSMVSLDGGVAETDCPGIAFWTKTLAEAPAEIDTLFLPGGNEAPAIAQQPAMIEAVRLLAGRARRIATICSGAFFAAEAGLMEGRKAATHWIAFDLFAQRYPGVTLDRDSIWVEDGPVWSSAGISSGVDLTLALIERDYGSAIALNVARLLVVFAKRSGGQKQFSNILSAQIADAGGPLGPLFAWIADNLNADLGVEILAGKAGMSPRTFARACAARTGMPPARAIEAMRVQAARDSIEQTDTPLGAVASRYGFGDEQRMRRAFMRHYNATPMEIRTRFTL